MARTSTLVTLAVGAALVLSACGSTAGPGGAPSSSASPSAGTPSATAQVMTDPLGLVGSWLVSGDPDVTRGTVLRISDDLSLWSSCGYVMGGWRADQHGLFVGSIMGGDEPCVRTARDVTPAWLTSVSRYAEKADGFDLMATDGTVIVHLAPGGRPTPGPNLLPSLADPPVVTDLLRTAYAPPAPLPSPLRPATAAELVGRWDAVTPPAPSPLQRAMPGVVLRAAGHYSATDGCNGTDGRWAANDSGSFIGTSGFSTLIGCDNVDVGHWIASATSAGFDGAVLVLVDKAGHELGRLQRP